MIRLYEKKDAPELLAIYTHYVQETVVTFDTKVPTLAAFENKIDQIMETAPCFVCELAGRVVGYAYAAPYRDKGAYQWTKELTVYVDGNYQKQKIGTALYITLVDVLKLQHYRHLVVAITLPNIPSVGFHQRMGFLPVGVFENVGIKFGKGYRVGWYQLSLQDMYEPAQPILPYRSILQQPEGQKALIRGASRILA